MDLVLWADGGASEVARAYDAAWTCFAPLLEELVRELDLLRQLVGEEVPFGETARRMHRAVLPHGEEFVTPMAAVAGAVADQVLAAMCAAADLPRAYVNNGGDIAFHLAAGQSLRTGIVADTSRPRTDSQILLRHDFPSRGLATSGWRGRSHSLGVADAVTVLAKDAAAADAAATLIGNRVNVQDTAIVRRSARELAPDSDLGSRPVTVEVGPLSDTAIASALTAGHDTANRMRGDGLLDAVLLQLQGHYRTEGVAESLLALVPASRLA